MKIINQETQLVPVDQLTPHPRNPREGDIGAIHESIETHGFYGFVIAQRSTGHVLAGNHRLQAAKQTGATEIPTVWVDVDDAQALKILLADNRTNDLASYNTDALATILQELAENDDLFGTGYDGDALDDLLADLGDAITPPTDAPEARISEAEQLAEAWKTKTGQLWRIGEHRLLIGDATKPKDYERLLGSSAAHMVLTDPPYNVSYEGKTQDGLTIQNDQMSDSDFREFLSNAFNAMCDHTEPGGAIYVFHADTEGANFRNALVDGGYKLAQCLVWVKNSLVMGRQDYHWKHEPILYGWKEGAAHNWHGDRKQTTVLEFDRPSRNAEHPTMKPLDILQYLIGNSSRRGQIILDPFAGSGSTLLASNNMQRTGYGMEIDPKYAAVILQRFADSGLTPTLAD